MQTDFLAELLRRPHVDPWVIAVGVLAAFGFGALHALEPGHGKTLVAAYLVGSRGTMKHAALLGASVTVTHTFSVFVIGLATLFVSSYVVPEKIIPVLSVLSGLMIVAIGLWLLVKRYRTWHHLRVHHAHDHAHSHHHHHHHDHGHDHAHAHDHSHPPEGDVTMTSLITLGASGGLVPCPAAMVLMLSAIALGKVALGLFLLIAFSIGLAGVLVAIGALVIYAKNWIPKSQQSQNSGWMQAMPVLSAAVVTVVGVLMTAASLGWIPLRL